MVGGEEIAALGLGDVGEVGLPGIGEEDRRAALIEPVDFLFAEQKDAAEDEFGDAVGMGLGVGKGKSGTPGAAEDLPAVDVEVLAQFLDVGDEVPGGVGFERGVGRALAASALVEIHDAVLIGVEEPPLFGIGTAAWAAVHEDDGLAGGVAAFLEVELVDGRDLEAAGVVGLDGRVEPGDGIFG